MADTQEQPSADGYVELTVTHHGQKHSFSLPETATLTDLTKSIESTLSIPPPHQKFMITPKVGLIKPPYPDPLLSVTSLASKKIQLLAPLSSDLASLAPPPARLPPVVKAATPARTINHKKAHDDTTYTFHTIIPLPYLPNPERSRAYLERLRDDPGIKSAMAKHKFSVGVLTEMNPAEHTTHESRTLGLNRNRGEVIELRLRTDAYDGYRDYRTIRKTLCHELAHNVFGDHDRNFWDLTKQIEKEVERGDWKSGGRSVGEQEFYNPNDGGVGEHIDGGGWSGGEFVVGGSSGEQAGLTRREILAQAAEERMKRQRESDDAKEGGSNS